MDRIASLIDHTNLKPDASEIDIKNLCLQAIKYDFFSVCVNPIYVPQAVAILKSEKPTVCTVIGFPLGADFPKIKSAETQTLRNIGAQEFDMVVNIGAIKNGNYDITKTEISNVVNAAKGACVKVIIETCLLTKNEIIKVCNIAKNSGATFVKTSTGYSHAGATAENVTIMKEVVGEKIGIKASGGIKTMFQIQSMLDAGASRIGTSAGVSIMNNYRI